MDFLELGKRRFSARQYKADPVECEKLRQVMKAGRLASSARNMQAWHFNLVQDDVQREKVANIYRRTWLRQTPIMIRLKAGRVKYGGMTDGYRLWVPVNVHSSYSRTGVPRICSWPCPTAREDLPKPARHGIKPLPLHKRMPQGNSAL
jgi:nitroreductase